MHARPGVLHTLGRGARASAHGSDVLLVEHGGLLLALSSLFVQCLLRLLQAVPEVLTDVHQPGFNALNVTLRRG